MRQGGKIALFIAALIFTGAVVTTAETTVKFTVRLENISSPDGQKASDGGKWPFALSPGVWVVHRTGSPFFTAGKRESGRGLEAQAEDGNPSSLAASLAGQKGTVSSGVFNTPVGASEPDPILPGGAYEFTFTAAKGDKLSVATMFGQSNDLFYAFSDKGTELFDDKGRPISGDITRKITLWDAGTEVNQEPGVGSFQAPRQSTPNTGASERKPVRSVKDVKDGFTYPGVSDVMRITIAPQGNTRQSSAR